MSAKHPPIELSVIAPMYNEEDNVETTIQAIQAALEDFSEPWELVFVNDGSTDNTLEVARSWEAKVENLRVLSYPVNVGRGKALRTGFENARGQYVVSIDFDLTYSPDHILRLYRELKDNPNVDVVLGSAYMKGGKTVGVAPFHLFLSRWGNRVLEIAFGGRFKTITCVLRGYRREVLEALVLESNRKEIHLEILSKVVALGYYVVEIPATLTRRQKGKSKTRFGKTSISHLLFSVYERPVILFSMLGAVLLVIGFIFGIYLSVLRFIGQLNPGRPLFYVVVLFIVTGVQLLSFGVIAGQNSFLRNEIYKLQSRLKLMENRDRHTNQD
ncbi:MAG: glycosyltransferase family 2 protein [Anaerolineales bacterium]|nr:glycosyltransferase family 2 protein [Anaerolineales bacterium]